MEFNIVESLVKLVPQYWMSSIIAIVFLVYFIKTNSNQTKIMISLLQEIKELSTKRVLEKNQAIAVFRAILSQHIHQKLVIAKNRLIANNLTSRSTQIKSFLSAEFRKITQEEIAILEWFVTTWWSMGDILSEILEPSQWKIFMDLVYGIFFWEWTIENKLEDLGAMMSNIVNNMVQKLEDRLK